MTTLQTPDGENVVVSTDSDVSLYKAPRYPANTGNRHATAGTDIYAHKARSGSWYYYTYSWSMWRSAGYSLITPTDVQDRLIGLAGLSGFGRMNDNEMKNAEQYVPGITTASRVTDEEFISEEQDHKITGGWPSIRSPGNFRKIKKNIG